VSKLLTLEGIVEKYEGLLDELRQAESDYLRNVRIQARVARDYSKGKAEALIEAPGKNAQERQAYVDIKTDQLLEEDLVWTAIVRAADNRIRSLQAQIGVIRSLISTLDRQKYKSEAQEDLSSTSFPTPSEFPIQENIDNQENKEMPF